MIAIFRIGSNYYSKMKRIAYCCIIFWCIVGMTACTAENPRGIEGSNTRSESRTVEVKEFVLDSTEGPYGSFLMAMPQTNSIQKGILVLLPGFGQQAKDIFLDTDFAAKGTAAGWTVVAYTGHTRMTADSFMRAKLGRVLAKTLDENKLPTTIPVFMGGFSAGGVIALRYAEWCQQYPNRTPVRIRGIFMADAPIDLFHSWTLLQELRTNNYSEISVQEADMVEQLYKRYYGNTPTSDVTLFSELSPFSIDPAKGQNEQYLKGVAVRSYHDIDVNWRLKNRNQTPKYDNFIATAELINRLNLSGNKEAEFIQVFEKGYRRDGRRHPHSWSIVDEVECLEWMNQLIQ